MADNNNTYSLYSNNPRMTKISRTSSTLPQPRKTRPSSLSSAAFSLTQSTRIGPHPLASGLDSDLAASPTRQQRPSDLERPQRPRGRFFYIQSGSQDLQGDRLQGDRLQGARILPSCRQTRTTRTTLPRTMPWPSGCQPSGPISQEPSSHKQRPNSLFATSQLTAPITPT